MSGYSYLNGHRWADVTREERYFCQHLFNRLKDKNDLRKFIDLLNSKKTITLDPDADWEPAYEVCFYRDRRFLNEGVKDKEPFSQKRTFDLCLFSEQTIVIIEAKAHQGFDSDQAQLGKFEEDKCNVRKMTRARAFLLGLASGLHIGRLKQKPNDVFDWLISWEELAQQLFDNDHKPDPVLVRADSIYKGGK